MKETKKGKRGKRSRGYLNGGGIVGAERINGEDDLGEWMRIGSGGA